MNVTGSTLTNPVPQEQPRQSVIYPKDNFLNEASSKVYDMTKEEELRIEIERGETIRLSVESGFCEIEGAELPLNIVVNFTNVKFSIFCWTDARIKVEGNPLSIYPSESNKTSMNQYLMVHNIINEARKEALMNNRLGPKILVTGSESSGKTSLCHMLLNWALKFGWTPVYVDLDTSNEISVPGTIAAAVVDYPLPNHFLIDSAISIFNGSNLSETNPFLYQKQVNELSSTVLAKLQFDLDDFKKKFNLFDMKSKDTNRLETFSDDETPFVHSEHPTIYSSGFIVHCPNISASKDSYIYKNIIEDFKIDMIFVIENEKLYNLIKNINFSGEKNILAPSVSLLHKTQGINSDVSYKEFVEQKRFDAYFKGPFNNLKITEFKLDLSNYKFLQIISSNVTSSLLPIGSTSELNIILREVNLEENLINRVVAIIHLEDKIIKDLDSNYDRKLNSYVEVFSRAPVSFFAYM